ncbi:MAG TPA: hypothetical protein VFV50_09385 [Bdellovibrionales bacterium]|nr:hypothetical protein [Bdellovibrionales bacterium]
MFNKLVILAVLGLSATAAAENKNVVDCKAVKIIDDSVFEESLSTHEHTDVYIEADANGKLVLASVGANIDYERKKGDIVRQLPSEFGRNRYILRRALSDRAFMITVSQGSGPRPGTAWGNISVQNGNGTWSEIAVLVCKK